MKNFLSLLILLCIFSGLTAQSTPLKYRQIILPAGTDIAALNAVGAGIDHLHTTENGGIEIIVSEREAGLIQAAGVIYETLIPDMSTYYRTILNAGESRNADCGLENFDTGEMGGYHSLSDAMTHIGSMQSMFPELVQIFEIGNSIEGRPIFAVKISDNVATDESDQEGVAYYDALIHAREPLALESTLYYMWWLLENYAEGGEATYLVNHREMFFIPVLNPDGYAYNQLIEPNGGGLWRKNRRVIGGNECDGIDLNRNFGVRWGDTSGSSNNPCSNLYHGEAAYSEPETQASKYLFDSIRPATAFTTHSFSDVMILPNAFDETPNRFDIYAEYASEFSPQEYLGYGTGIDLIFYSSTGNSRDYMDSLGAIAYVPEVGSAFWEPSSVICDRVQEMLPAMKFMSWAAGEFSRFHDAQFLNGGELIADEPLQFNLRLKHRGMAQLAENVSVVVSSEHPSLTAVRTEINYGDIAARSFADNGDLPFEFLVSQSVMLNEPVAIKVAVFQDGLLSDERELTVFGGRKNVLFEDDAENGMANWQTDGPNWGTTTIDAVSGEQSFADSPERNYQDFIFDDYLILSPAIDLTDATDPWIEFNAKWSFDLLADYVRPLVSTNNGLSWQSLEGIYTRDDYFFPAYIDTRHWVAERISLNNYVGEDNLRFAFSFTANQGRQSDGFYFDDFKIIDYAEQDTMVNTTTPSALARSLQIFPNPTQDRLEISYEAYSNEEINIRLLDGRGGVARSQKIQLGQVSGRRTLDLSGLPVGMYYLEVTSGAERVYRKVIKGVD